MGTNKKEGLLMEILRSEKASAFKIKTKSGQVCIVIKRHKTGTYHRLASNNANMHKLVADSIDDKIKGTVLSENGVIKCAFPGLLFLSGTLSTVSIIYPWQATGAR